MTNDSEVKGADVARVAAREAVKGFCALKEQLLNENFVLVAPRV